MVQMWVYTDNLIYEFFGYTNDCQFDSDTCSDEAKGYQKLIVIKPRCIMEYYDTIPFLEK